MSNEPDYAVSPGDYLRDWMEETDSTSSDLAYSSALDIKYVDDILAGKPLSIIVAGGLERATEYSATWWMKMEDNYRADLKRIESQAESLVTTATSNSQDSTGDRSRVGSDALTHRLQTLSLSGLRIQDIAAQSCKDSITLDGRAYDYDESLKFSVRSHSNPNLSVLVEVLYLNSKVVWARAQSNLSTGSGPDLAEIEIHAHKMSGLFISILNGDSEDLEHVIGNLAFESSVANKLHSALGELWNRDVKLRIDSLSRSKEGLNSFTYGPEHVGPGSCSCRIVVNLDGSIEWVDMSTMWFREEMQAGLDDFVEYVADEFNASAGTDLSLKQILQGFMSDSSTAFSV